MMSIAVAYTLLCRRDYGNQVSFHKVIQPKNISAVKVNMSYEKNISFYLILKFQKGI